MNRAANLMAQGKRPGPLLGPRPGLFSTAAAWRSVQKSVAGLVVGKQLEAQSLLPLTIAGLRLLRLEVDRVGIVAMLVATRVLVRAKSADLFLADPVLGRVGHELAAPSSSHASNDC